MAAASTPTLTHLDQPDARARVFSRHWLAPRLVAITLLAIVLSALGERAGLGSEIILALNIVSYLAGGFFGAKSAIESLRCGEIDVDLLMVLAALGAAVIGEWHEGAILLFLFSLSNVLQDYAMGRSRAAIRSLFTLYPEVATVRRGDQIETVKIDEINIGDTVLIQPGERIPADGEVIARQFRCGREPDHGRVNSSVDKAPATTCLRRYAEQTGHPRCARAALGQRRPPCHA